MMEELILSFLLGQHHMNKKHKAKEGLPSKGWDQIGARIKRRRDHAQSNQVEHPREERSRVSYHSSPMISS
jgi:hypothetical protein